MNKSRLSKSNRYLSYKRNLHTWLAQSKGGSRDLVDLQIRPPLETPGGIKSDHNCVFASFDIQHVHVYTKKSITVRPRTKKGERLFKQRIVLMDWNEVLNAESSTEKVQLMNEILDNLMKECFPEKILCIKSTDDPWINKEIKRKIKKRKREFLSLIHI